MRLKQAQRCLSRKACFRGWKSRKRHNYASVKIMTKRLLTEDFEVLGFWYLPEKSERRITGKLSYSEKRSILFLQEPLVSEEAFFHLSLGINIPSFMGLQPKVKL